MYSEYVGKQVLNIRDIRNWHVHKCAVLVLLLSSAQRHPAPCRRSI